METRKFTVLIIFLCYGFLPSAFAQSDTEVDIFISLFAETAVEEMERSGIPASITLAQGILESSSGRSRLAIEGNNYFGIKCGSKWTGDSIQHKDDDYDENGNLMHSCFRAYALPETSFQDHSDFLTNRKRYKVLFSYGKDYKKWAHGLQRCGYATNKAYGSLLISIIEKHNLAAYDKKSSTMANDAMMVSHIPEPKKLEAPATATAVAAAPTVSTAEPPKAVMLTENYARGSQSVQKMQERSVAAVAVAVNNSAQLIEPKMAQARDNMPSASSQTIVLQRGYKSRIVKAK